MSNLVLNTSNANFAFICAFNEIISNSMKETCDDRQKDPLVWVPGHRDVGFVSRNGLDTAFWVSSYNSSKSFIKQRAFVAQNGLCNSLIFFLDPNQNLC